MSGNEPILGLGVGSRWEKEEGHWRGLYQGREREDKTIPAQKGGRRTLHT